MRTSFIEQLVVEARRNPRIFLVVGDLGFSVVESFAREFPDRYLNAGIAEQNMTGVAAGLASEGYHVFTYSIANFPTFRCAEQIRNDVVYHQLPVTVVAVGGGLAYGNLGYSHHAVQDIALLRTFPGMMLGCPGDPLETRSVVSYLVSHSQPSYLRLGKAGEPVVHSILPRVEPGVIVWVSGSAEASNVMLTTGAALKIAQTGFGEAAARGWALGSLPLWSDSDRPRLAEALAGRTRIVVVEDHLRAGGFGSYVREALDAVDWRGAFQSVALDAAITGQVASQAALNAAGGLNAAAVEKAMDRVMRIDPLGRLI